MPSINFFPPELLYEIFEHNMENGRCDLANFKTLVNTSQVCSRWRNILLDSHASKLWAHCLDFCLPADWTARIMERSGDKPLAVTIPSFTPLLEDGDMDANDPYLVWKFAERIRNYIRFSPPKKLQYPGSPFPDDISFFTRCNNLMLALNQDQWRSSYPLIQDQLYKIRDINLICMGTKQKGGFKATTIDASRPWQAKSLEFWNCSIPLHLVPKFPSLEKLLVTEVPAQCMLTPLGWLQVLERMPAIQTIHLDEAFANPLSINSLDPRLGQRPTSDAVIQLCHLKDIALKRATIPNANQFLRQLGIPAQCDLTLELTMVSMDQSFDLLCQYLRERYAHHSISKEDSVSIGLSLDGCTISVDSDNALDLTLNWPQAFPDAPPLNFEPEEALVKVLNALQGVCSAVHFLILRSVVYYPFPGEAVYRLFNNATEMSIISLDAYTYHAIVPFLTREETAFQEPVDNAEAGEHPPVNSRPTLLPALRLVEYYVDPPNDDLDDLSMLRVPAYRLDQEDYLV